MTGLFSPRYLNEGREMLKAFQKMLCYRRDLLKPKDLEAIETGMGCLEKALKEKNQEEVEKATKTVDDLFSMRFPSPNDGGLREHCEVLLVAIVIAIGVRTFFLQPFTIPTGSMQPTLNGIIGYPTEAPAPNYLVQLVDFIHYGRTYFEWVSKEDDTIVKMEDTTRFTFPATTVTCQKQQFVIMVPSAVLSRTFGVDIGRPLKAGEIVARGYVDTGDHVFVDKVSYNFRAPHRGEVFVFSTNGIQTGENLMHPGGPSQFYIKRLAGLPGDLLRIDSPHLYINSQPAAEPGFVRVMSQEDGYRGYSNPSPLYGAHYLLQPDSVFHVPDKSYFALGDNSYNSSDSRYWGVVPEHNLMGHGLFVYWPFTSHWGFIK